MSSGPPNINGGNVDTKQISVGATVFMPVFETGAYFAVGDGHAAQGKAQCLLAWSRLRNDKLLTA